MKILLALIVAISLSACSTVSSGGKAKVIKEKGATITYTLPQGWKTVKVEEPADHFNIIAPAGATKLSDPSITIDYSDISKATEGECAKAYLMSVQEIKDPKVRMSTAGAIRTTKRGSVLIYRLASSYYGDHLVSFLVQKRGYVIVELWANTSKERAENEAAFREVVQGLDVKN